jgi:hypothetical protein
MNLGIHAVKIDYLEGFFFFSFVQPRAHLHRNRAGETPCQWPVPYRGQATGVAIR